MAETIIIAIFRIESDENLFLWGTGSSFFIKYIKHSIPHRHHIRGVDHIDQPYRNTKVGPKELLGDAHTHPECQSQLETKISSQIRYPLNLIYIKLYFILHENNLIIYP